MNIDQLNFIKIIKPLNLTGTFVEVGTWKGEFASRLLQFLDCKMLYCVDPYISFDDDIYRDTMNGVLKQHGQQLYEVTKLRLEEIAPGRVQMIRKPSLEAVNEFQDNSIDFIYIDANHDYEYVLKDILAWYPKVKAGGILSGDDIWSTNMNDYTENKNMFIQFKDIHRSKAFFGVYPAIKEAERLLGITFHIVKSQFYCIKPM